MIKKAYTRASLRFVDTDYIECHGTGTELGDPVEVAGIHRCFLSNERPVPLMIGGVSITEDNYTDDTITFRADTRSSYKSILSAALRQTVNNPSKDIESA